MEGWEWQKYRGGAARLRSCGAAPRACGSTEGRCAAAFYGTHSTRFTRSARAQKSYPDTGLGDAMTLHEAMRQVLRSEPARQAKTRRIADEITRRESYRRKDGGFVAARQVNARARQYVRLFRFVAPGLVELIE